MKKYIAILFSVAALATVSCNKEIEPVGSADGCGVSYSFCANVGDPETKVTYHDNIGAKDNPYNPNSDGSNKITMSWRHGDELVAIRWKEPYDEYVVLQANIAEGSESHSIEFDTETATNHFKTPLQEGERFVLVHGDFVLDPNKGDHPLTFDGVTPKLAFPTSEISKDGFGRYIHHGGVVEGNKITFRNQDGTLENLRKHEYMVADAYVHFEMTNYEGDPIPDEETGIISVTLTDSPEKEGGNSVEMHIAHTLLRLTMFLPDEDFDNGYDDDLIAVSIRDASLHKIFHRYFRMHPNATDKAGDPNYYRTSYNPNSDKEENPYIRINLVDETTGKHGVSHRTTNIFGAAEFNPKKPVCVPATLSGKPGHYVTLYFSLPSRHMGVEGQGPCNLDITAFTRTHAYRTTKTYQLPDAAMQPGQVVPLNVNFVGNSVRFRAITDPELGITFAPGLVYANKVNDEWKYDIYQNQGQYAGMSHQTLDFGEYFTFGSVDPTEAAHYEAGDIYKAPKVHINDFKDVAALVHQTASDGVTDINNLYSLMTKQEAERVMARLKEEVSKGLFLGYYYYDDGNGNTKHKAPGSHNPTILAAAASGSKSEEELKAMSASVGIYVGRSSQPKFEEQDDFVFLPNSKQMHNGPVPASNQVKVWTVPDVVAYVIPNDYTDLDATGDETKLTSKFSTKFKFSTWTRTIDKTNPYRVQVWTNDTGTRLDNSMSNVADGTDGLFARPVRPVIY